MGFSCQYQKDQNNAIVKEKNIYQKRSHLWIYRYKHLMV